MILSMTGFGRAESVFEGRKITVDIKSLNSKNFDLNIKLPFKYREKEFELRKTLNDRIQRGKVDCFVNLENLAEISDVKVNKDLVENYISQLKAVTDDGPDFEYLKMAVRLPDAISTKAEDLNESEYKNLLNTILEALDRFEEFRKTEGGILQKELQNNLNRIEQSLQRVLPYEEERMVTIKEKYHKTLQEFDTIDETRFYQEMAYYTEKLDVSEEKIRLAQHLKYYQQVMEEEQYQGKKLGFISQEIGREINTLGSKANHAEIQKIVVEMKDELEKMKEQALNIL